MPPTMRQQDILIPVAVPTVANQRKHRFAKNDQKAKQQDEARLYLEAMGVRPELEGPGKCTRIFVVVTLIRVSRGSLEDDNLRTAFKAIRDTVARWAHGIPEKVPRMKDGRPVFKGGKIRMTRPRAPDGAKDGIRFRYGQQSTREVGRTAARILIEQIALPTTTLTLIE